MSRIKDFSNISKLIYVILTESSTINFKHWVSQMYDKSGTIYKMINTGYYNIEVLSSIIFQILYIFLYP